MYQFRSGIIKCLNCGGKFRGKKQRSKIVYFCSTYNKFPTKCYPKVTISEEELIYVIQKHLHLQNKTPLQPISENIVEIKVREGEYTIIYKDNTTSVINTDPTIGVKLKF